MPEREFASDMLARPIRDLGLTIEGSRLEPIVREFLDEVREIGLERVTPSLYLSTEWGVPEGTIAIAIPFYLAREDLMALHAQRAGHVEGRDPADILRYLRHEMGHVVNYAYRLFATDEWERLFGPITKPYLEDYHPEPFSRDFVRHLPGWYAQKHPDEDWAETFAVWMTPGSSWRRDYAEWPVALEKLHYCDRIIRSIADSPPMVISHDRDEDVSEIAHSLEDYYARIADLGQPLPSGLDEAMREIFADRGDPSMARTPASALIRNVSRDIAAEVFRWTGFFPERTMTLLGHMAERADGLGLVYVRGAEAAGIVGLTALITALGSNLVGRAKSGVSAS